jgi:hypothetical protein
MKEAGVSGSLEVVFAFADSFSLKGLYTNRMRQYNRNCNIVC